MIKILGIKVHNLSKREVGEKIREFLHSKKANFVTTPNPEIVLHAHKDEEYFYILNKADLSLADGVGLKLPAFLKKINLKRITGADILPKILEEAEKQNKKVLIANREEGLSNKEELKKYLNNFYPELNYEIIEIKSKTTPILNQVTYEPNILIASLGFPYQEKFLYKNLKTFSSLNLAIGIGGAFDFLTKKAKRAPKLLRILGLEWLWRLFNQPKRYKRIFRAVCIFSYQALKNNLILPFFYRRNVSCLLYKESEQEYKILLVNREDEKNHWQLPQGGTEGETLEKGGSREIEEELNITNFFPEKTYKNLYQYKFPKTGKNKRYQGYKGQKQGLLIAKFLGEENEIKVNYWDHSDFKWVDLDEVLSTVHPVRRKATEIFLNRFKNFKEIENKS